MEEKDEIEENISNIYNSQRTNLSETLHSFDQAIKIVKNGDWTLFYSLLKHTSKVDFDIDTLDEVCVFFFLEFEN
jgi:hypothetical protein